MKDISYEMKYGACETCVFAIAEEIENYVGEVSGGYPETPDDPDSWSKYTQLYCRRYPKWRKVSDLHVCGEYISGEYVKRKGEQDEN